MNESRYGYGPSHEDTLKRNRTQRLLQLSQVTLAASLMFNYVTINSEESTPVHEYEQACEPLSEEIYENEVPELFNQSYEWNKHYRDTFNTNHERRQAVGSELGLTMYDIQAELNDLSEDLYVKDASEIPIEQYYSRISTALRNFDIDLQPAMKFEGGSIENGTQWSGSYTYQDMVDDDSSVAKENLLNLATTIGDLPVELIQTLGVTQVLLTDEGPGGYFSHENPNAVYLNINYASGDIWDHSMVGPPMQTTFLHEAAHVWHYKLCGSYGMYSDTEFAAHNPDGLKFYQESTVKTAERGYSSLEAVERSFEGTSVLSDEVQMQLNNTVTLKEYGRASVHEDFATTTTALLTGLTQTDPFMSSSIVTHKQDTILGRILSDDPRNAQFLVHTGRYQSRRSTSTATVLPTAHELNDGSIFFGTFSR